MKKRANAEIFHKELVDYWDKLSPADRKWLRRFNNEYHNGGAVHDPKADSGQILKGEEMVEEANRNQYSTQVDPLAMAERGHLIQEEVENETEFLEDASDEWEWRDGYRIGGFEMARKVILHQTITHLETHQGQDMWELVLMQMHSKLEELKQLRRREWSKGKKK